MLVEGGLYKNNNTGAKVWVMHVSTSKVFYKPSGTYCVDNMDKDAFECLYTFIKSGEKSDEIALGVGKPSEPVISHKIVVGDTWKSRYTENRVKVLDTYEDKVSYEWVNSGGKQATVNRRYFTSDFKWESSEKKMGTKIYYVNKGAEVAAGFGLDELKTSGGGGFDPISKPKHYNSHPSGIQCIEVTRHMSFSAGNVIKYLWRNGLKDGEPSLKDLKKAAWYLDDLIKQTESKSK